MNPKTGNTGKYAEEIIKPLTPSQWDKQNLSKGYLPHPGYAAGKRKVDQYKEYYNPSIFTPTLTDNGYQWKNLQDPKFDFSTNLPVERYAPPAAKQSIEINPNTKPIQFTPTSTYNPNTGITYGLDSKILDIENVPIASKKKGGLVKKMADGGFLADPNTLAAGTQLLNMGGNQLTANQQGQTTINENQAALGGGLKGAATGAALGAQVGSVVPGVGTVIGLGVGALAGGALGSITAFNKAKNSNSDIQNGIDNRSKEQKRAEDEMKFNTGLANQFAARNGYKDGGKIVGKGTDTSDSIKAKIKEGSFIVPAKNAVVAKMIKNKVLGGEKEEKAELNHPDGETVKLSNGEYVFSPEETKELIANGVDVNDLAPDAEHGEDEMAKGGLSAAKARIMLHDGTIRGKSITDKQRKYFGYIASGHKFGGMIKGYADGGEIGGDPFEQIRKKAIADQKEADLEERKALMEEFKSLKEKAASGNPIDKFTYNKRLPEIGNRLKQINEKHGLTNKSMPSKTGAEIQKTLGSTNVPRTTPSGLAAKTAAITPSTASESLNRTMANQDAYNAVTVPNYVPNAGLAAKVGGNAIDNASSLIDPNIESYNRDLAAGLADQKAIDASKGNRNKNIANGLSTALNYGIPLVQAGIGLNFLKKAGPRPVDQIDPEFTSALANVKTRASYGFSPEEQTLLNNNNNNLTAAQRFSARNLAGGSAGNAFAMERSAINDSYGRGLSSALANRNLQLNKQQYADQLGLNKVELSRRLFDDKMRAWQQNQNAGAGLVQSGLNNLIGSNRYEQEKRSIADNNNTANNWINSLG